MSKVSLNAKLYNAYQKGGASAVYIIANRLKLPYSFCERCEADTPTIKHVCKVCGVCSTPKNKTQIQR